MVPALYLNIYNLQMLPLILSFILLMCFICLNSYLAFPAIKQQGLWPVFHSSHADPIDLTLICRIFFTAYEQMQTCQKTALFALAAPQDFHNDSVVGHQAFPASQRSRAGPIHVRDSIPDSSSSGHCGDTATGVHCSEHARAMLKC